MTGPNDTVLRAQAMVCTGPHQTRPLGLRPSDPDPHKIICLILGALKGTFPSDISTSRAQMGAFFAAMTIRRKFPPKTNWSIPEKTAFESLAPELKEMPHDLTFLLDPTSLPDPLSIEEKVVIEALSEILRGNHLNYDQTKRLGQSILNGDVRDSLKGAALIGQRMNLETFEEARGYRDAAFDPGEILEVSSPSLTHFGEPYDGSRRYFRPTLFVAAIRSALGRPTVIHGVDEMPPKLGVTEEQILIALGANTKVTLTQAARLVEDPDVGFAHVSQRLYSPGSYAARELRRHIQKRPPWAATEKTQMFLRCSETNHMVIGYYHSGYEQLFLNMMEDWNLDSGLVTKGLEGSSGFSLKPSSAPDPAHRPVNSTLGVKRVNEEFFRFSADVNPADSGLQYDQHPRPEEISAKAFARTGMEALSGRKGAAFDQLVFNVGIKDHLLGFCTDPYQSIAQAAKAIESGKALAHLEAYLEKSKAMCS
ncbi:MAG: hypothetical protein CME25_00985 [Gemmatimonadetes bacterium]|nr:hypothetical protein [Gemmatimonadota bacterium]